MFYNNDIINESVPGENAIWNYRVNPANVPIFCVEGKYYVSMGDVESYMEASMIIDPVEALNNIAEAAVRENSDISPDNFIVVGAVDENCTMLESAGVLMEMKAKDLMSISQFDAKIRVAAKKMIGKLKKNPDATASAYDKEIKNLERVIDEIDGELSLSDKELGKKKMETAARMVARAAIQTTAAGAAGAGIGIGASQIGSKVVGKALLSSKECISIFKNVMKPIATGALLGSTAAGAVWTIMDYRKALENYKKEANRVIEVLKKEKQKALDREKK